MTQIRIPTLVRIKPGALDRVGVYLRRAGHGRVVLVSSQGLSPEFGRRLDAGLGSEGIEVLLRAEAVEASFGQATSLLQQLPREAEAVVGLGGGKALDVAKYVAFLARLPYYAVPTSLSNDGFCSPQSSLTLAGRRRSLPAALPYAVVVDTEVCRLAPRVLWLSGVGDLLSKVTAVHDWKLAFHARGEPVNDFAALLSEATVRQFMACPELSPEGICLLATALMLNGIAMEVCGSSRPASGSEHLISHALDGLSARPRLHGLQVGVATYLVSLLQHHQGEAIGTVLDAAGFWTAIEADPFSRSEWLEAVRVAPSMKPGYFTVLSERNVLPEVESLCTTEPRLVRCFDG